MQAASAQMVIPPEGSMGMGGGTNDMSCVPVLIGGSFEGGLNHAGDLTIETGGVLSSAGDTLHLGSGLSNNGTLNVASSSVVMDGSCAPAGGRILVSGTVVVSQLTISSTSGQTFVFQPDANITVTDTLTVQGQPGQPVTLLSANGQTILINLGPQAVVTQTDVASSNVQIGAPVTPSSIQPVPAWSPAMGAALSLLMLPVAAGALRRRRSFKRPHSQP